MFGPRRSRARPAAMLTRGRDDVPLVPVTVVAPQFRSLFPYQVFNAMQSQCFEAAYGSDQCMVVSSPTGSGKTVVLELALARLWSTSTDPATRPTAIYIAPLKALTHERLLDWRTKLSGLDIKCFELTGDTEDADFTEQAVRDADLIVTTPEKWGSTSNVQPWCQPLCPGDGLERRARPRAALRTPTPSQSVVALPQARPKVSHAVPVIIQVGLLHALPPRRAGRGQPRRAAAARRDPPAQRPGARPDARGGGGAHAHAQPERGRARHADRRAAHRLALGHDPQQRSQRGPLSGPSAIASPASCPWRLVTAGHSQRGG